MTTDIIPPSEIQSELTRIWDSLEGTNKMRASLFNLIFFTKKNERRQYIQEISQKVIEKFPSRVIFITEDTEANKDYLSTRVAVTPSGNGDSDIACDYIQIDVGGAHLERVPFVILPQLLTDLPTYTIWAESPSNTSPLYSLLKKISSRMIFDSESIENLSSFAKELLDLENEFNHDIADLNWARVESWRNLITSTFYTQERLDKLNHAKSIQILYNAKESAYVCHTQFQSIYLQGWIATQLGWKLKEMKTVEGALHYTYDKEDSTVQITLYPEVQEGLKAGTILSVDIETEEGDHFSFGRKLDIPNHVSMRFSTLEKCDIPLKYIFAKEESGQSLVKEICHKGTSQHYVNLLSNIQNRKEYTFCEH